MKPKAVGLDFQSLVRSIVHVHEGLRFRAAKAVDLQLTLRNWLIGAYIVEYEQEGGDRAAYGARLLKKLAGCLRNHGLHGAHERELRRYRRFYLSYPQIRGTLSPEFPVPLPKIMGTAPNLSFSHFAELIELEDPLKRAFYEAECGRGNWSVRELRRQIGSLLYERAVLSKDKRALARRVNAEQAPLTANQLIRDPYVFEFLGLKPKEVMGESDLEDALLDKLKGFLLELGHGFCFEARQKRLVIGGKNFFVDLVFYHRILKCHVLIELKVDDFNHEHLGQLNTYVSWYRAHEMAKGDSPPIGILMCTKKNQALVEYALAGIDNRLFVSKYQLELPKKDDIRKFLEMQIKTESAGSA